MNKWVTGCALLFLASGLTACADDRYHVDYCGKKEQFQGAKDSYRAGENVKVYYGMLLTDTDYSFWLDDERLNCLYVDGKGYEISFTMPDHDVKLECRTYSSMTALPDPIVDPVGEYEWDYSYFKYIQDDKVAWKLPDYGTQFGGGMFLVKVTLETVSFPDVMVFGRDRRDICISEGDEVPLGGPNEVVLTVTEDLFGAFRCRTNIPLGIVTDGVMTEGTEFTVRSGALRLYDTHSGLYTCVYSIEQLEDY